MAFDELAQKLFGAKRAESNAVLTDATTGTIHGTALSDSADGAVLIEVTGDVTVPDEVDIGGEPYYADAGVGIEVPTSESVKAGDEVLVSVYGEGTLRSPVVTAAIGSGDRIAGIAQDAYDLADSVEGIAQQALDVANATGQHFWSDTDGAHVTEVTQEEWTDPTDPGYQSGPNSLWNSLGMLFRDGLNHLMALVAGKVVTDSFTVESGVTQYYYTQEPMTLIEVAFDGVATTDYFDYPQRGYILFYSTVIDQHIGETLTVKYRVSSSVSLFDGEGNADSNVVATFSNTKLELAKNNPDASIEMCGGNASIVYESSESWKPKTITVTGENGVTLKPNDTGANAAVEVLDGYGALSGVTIRSGGGSLAHSNHIHVWDESDLSLYDARIDIGTQTLNIQGIVNLFDSTGNLWDSDDVRARVSTTEQNYIGVGADGLHLVGMSASASGTVTVEQAIISLTRPMATWTGASGTVTDGAGWHQMGFSVLLAEHGPWSDYFTQTGGRITALRDVTLQLTMDLSWNDNVLGIRGAGFFKNSAVGSGVNEISSFSAKGANNRFYCVFPSRLITLNAGEYLNIGRYNQLANSIFTRGTNYTWLTVEVVG